MPLSKDQRRALKLLLDTSPQGCDKARLRAWGLKVEMLSRLVRDGLADIQPRTMRAGGPGSVNRTCLRMSWISYWRARVLAHKASARTGWALALSGWEKQ
jgi:hypothetical protein